MQFDGHIKYPRVQRWTLKESVSVTGPSPFEPITKQQTIIMSPFDGPGWYWKTSDGTLVPLDMSLVHVAGEVHPKKAAAMRLHSLHYLYLQHGQERLDCVEHALALRLALGLDGVVMEAQKGTTWIPYDGRAKIFVDALQDKLKPAGYLNPIVMPVEHICEKFDTKFGWNRNVTFDGNAIKAALEVTVVVDYKNFGGKKVVNCQIPGGDLSEEMREILCSRGVMQPPWIESKLRLLKWLGWPHEGNLLKRSEFIKENPDPYLEQIARHRMLDFFGALSVLAPFGTYLVGDIKTDKGNHGTDMLFLQEMKRILRQKRPDLLPSNPSPVAPASTLFRRVGGPSYSDPR